MSLTESNFATDEWLSSTSPFFKMDVVLLTMFYLAFGIIPAISLTYINCKKKKNEKLAAAAVPTILDETRKSEVYNM